jgi:hypothetical protein
LKLAKKCIFDRLASSACIRSLTISFFPLVQVQKAAKREKSNKSKKPGVDWQKAGLETP